MYVFNFLAVPKAYNIPLLSLNIHDRFMSAHKKKSFPLSHHRLPIGDIPAACVGIGSVVPYSLSNSYIAMKTTNYSQQISHLNE